MNDHKKLKHHKGRRGRGPATSGSTETNPHQPQPEAAADAQDSADRSTAESEELRDIQQCSGEIGVCKYLGIYWPADGKEPIVLDGKTIAVWVVSDVHEPVRLASLFEFTTDLIIVTQVYRNCVQLLGWTDRANFMSRCSTETVLGRVSFVLETKSLKSIATVSDFPPSEPPKLTLSESMAACAVLAIDIAQREFHAILDFSLESIHIVDDVLAKRYAELLDTSPQGLRNKEKAMRSVAAHFGTKDKKPFSWDPDRAARAVALHWGAYLGCVIQRRWGGSWSEFPGVLEDQIGLVVRNLEIYPVAQAFRRITRGADHDLWTYVEVLRHILDQQHPNDRTVGASDCSRN